MELAGERVERGKGEIEAAAGDNDDFDAARDGVCDGGRVFGRDLGVGVEEGTVEIEGDELDGHVVILAGNRKT